jgi:hypothetical protein
VLELKLAETEAPPPLKSVLKKIAPRLLNIWSPCTKPYECSVNSLGGICEPIGDGAPLTNNYLCWLKSEVDALPEVFTSVNENFMCTALEGILQMLRGENSIDFEALQRVASGCGTTVFPTAHEVKKTLQMIVKELLRLFGYKVTLSIVGIKLH